MCESLELNINDTVFGDSLLCQIIEETIQFSRRTIQTDKQYGDKLLDTTFLIEKSIDANTDNYIKKVLSDYLEIKHEEQEEGKEKQPFIKFQNIHILFSVNGYGEKIEAHAYPYTSVLSHIHYFPVLKNRHIFINLLNDISVRSLPQLPPIYHITVL